MNSIKKLALMFVVASLAVGYYIADQSIVVNGSTSAFLITYDNIEDRTKSADLIVEVELEGTPVNVLNTEDGFLSGYTLSDIKINRVIKDDPVRPVSRGDIINILEPYKVVDRGILKPGKIRIAYEDYTPIKKGSKYILFLSWMDMHDRYDISSAQEGKFNIDETDVNESKKELENIKFKELKDNVLATYGR